jgi:hypothetical protein
MCVIQGAAVWSPRNESQNCKYPIRGKKYNFREKHFKLEIEEPERKKLASCREQAVATGRNGR